MVTSYGFIIVGAGMSGINLAVHFLRRGVPANEIRIIDRHEAPLHLWFEMTRQVGMEQVRSPLSQHLGGEEDGLDVFITANKHTVDVPFDPVDPYRRPCLRVFNEYLRYIIAKYRITGVFKQGHVVRATPNADGGFAIAFKKGYGDEAAEILQAKHLILAIGYHDNRYIPVWNQPLCVEDSLTERDLQRVRWIQELKDTGADVHHIYEPDFDIDKLSHNLSTIVVGGGFSGVQLALKLIEKSNDVTLLIEYPLEVHYFDADPAWAEFASDEIIGFLDKDLAERRSIIQAARHQGSISPELKQQLDRAIKNKKIRLVLGDTQTADYHDSKITLHVKQKSNYIDITADRVVLATGYRLSIRAGGPWIDNLEKDLDLPTHDQYPALDDETLQWGNTHQLYVAGQLAELSLGPLARNIAGTQLSARRIMGAPSVLDTIRRCSYKTNAEVKR